MTAVPSGARAPDEPTTKREAAGQAADAAGTAASDVAGTAKEQARRVTGEASAQARNLASEVKGRVTDQARTQNDRVADGIRRMADELDQMRSDRTDGPAAAVVTRVADGGRQVADYLSRNGPEGVLREVQDFARRRPGAFLATALISGFVVGRLGKGVLNATEAPADAKPRTDSFVSATPAPADDPYGTETGTQYAATGTGRPTVVAEPRTEPVYTQEPRYDTGAGFEGKP
ncbi:hypothetical protein ACFQFC_37540 [Amorphoplanes digitatis]|uniref:Uncharacterized protein YjbJ (UPF0337 family) n=1 Tax=Actinoplanes digitatis TaxID=1868 RepID=A0A7W7HW81_9ACTN|nr:hypothetical protein [Actinoplanes digitatis]MBB4761864.1 uncharacterized protein YjbJ (UPF0337 family) [Actinoplanes digitatis]GID90975.1 hypothetical protein Adi01nite_03870 [Actinoplanes digitatis]